MVKTRFGKVEPACPPFVEVHVQADAVRLGGFTPNIWERFRSASRFGGCPKAPPGCDASCGVRRRDLVSGSDPGIDLVPGCREILGEVDLDRRQI